MLSSKFWFAQYAVCWGTDDSFIVFWCDISDLSTDLWHSGFYMAPPKHLRPKHKNALFHTFEIFLNNSDGIFRELRLRAFTQYWYLSYLKKVVHLRYVAFSPVGMHCFCTWSTVIWGLSQNIINFFSQIDFLSRFSFFHAERWFEKRPWVSLYSSCGGKSQQTRHS